MVVETRYVAGDGGVLVGSGNHWLLLTDPRDESTLDRLWRALGGSDPAVGSDGSGGGVAERVLAIVDEVFDQVPALALVDLTPGSGQSLSRGTGRVTVEGPARLLSLDAGSDGAAGPGGPLRRLVGGVVAAERAVVRPLAPQVAPVAPVPAPAARPGVGLIDGIPQAILAARGPDGPPPPRPRARVASSDSVPRDTSEPDPDLMSRVADPAPPVIVSDEHLGSSPVAEIDRAGGSGDHDGSTVFRPDHLVAASSVETVAAVWCPQGHLTSPSLAQCRVCRSQVAPQHAQQVPRPVLGGLRLPTGEVVPLDRGVVLGRRPQPVPGSGDWPHLVTLPPEHTFVSRMHLHLAVEGWQLVARDLGSRGGTTLKAPGRVPERLVADQPYVVEPGAALDLADTYEVRFEVGPEPGTEPTAEESREVQGR